MARIHTLRIRIEGPDMDTYDRGPDNSLVTMYKNFDEANQKVVDDLRSDISKVEDVVNDQLPDGFYCKVDE